MIKKFAQTLEFDIPEVLKPHIIAAIFGETDEKVEITFPVFPNGFPVLIHIFGDLPNLQVMGKSSPAPSKLNLAGQIQGAFPKMHINGRFGQNGFLLHPLTPYYLFHTKGEDFLNEWIALENKPLYDWASLHSRLEKCEKPLERVTKLAEMLIALEKKRLPPIPWLDQSIASIYSKKGNISVNELVRATDIGPRHFTRKFREIVGVPPKFLCKVVQLNSFFDAINTSDENKIPQLALECGYFDQSHFIHDFRKLIGDSPERFLRSKDAYVKEYLGRKKT